MTTQTTRPDSGAPAALRHRIGPELVGQPVIERTNPADPSQVVVLDFNADVKPGDIIVAGLNFGCGSSRQTAVEALQECGVAVVLAEQGFAAPGTAGQAR